jgi:hypothetical protein
MKFLKYFRCVSLVLEYKLKQRKTLINKVWSGHDYNQLELNKNGLFILKLIIGFYKC